jgi:hypothetical protein
MPQFGIRNCLRGQLNVCGTCLNEGRTQSPVGGLGISCDAALEKRAVEVAYDPNPSGG